MKQGPRTGLLIEVSTQWTAQERLGVAARLADRMAELASDTEPHGARMQLVAKWAALVARSPTTFLESERTHIIKLVEGRFD